MQSEQTDFDAAISDDDVIKHLTGNPEFFVNNQNVLARLRVPHASGNAVSLIERQVSVLRGRCTHLENSLRDLIAVARENENLVAGVTQVRHNDKRVKQFSEVFAKGSTRCGMPTQEQMLAMVGKEHANVASAAIIPLHFSRKLGVVMLTSQDESRFGAGKGVMFLDQMGELLSRRIHSYTAQRQVEDK